MVEVMVVVALVGALSAMVVWGIRGWAAANAFKGAPQQLSSLLRATQQQAITEGTDFCVQFVANQYKVYRLACSNGSKVQTKGPFDTGSSQVTLSKPLFKDPINGWVNGVTFTPRGSAWGGTVNVDRGSATHLVKVEGMTGHVSIDE